MLHFTVAFKNELKMIHRHQDSSLEKLTCCNSEDRQCENLRQMYKSIKKSSQRIEVLYKSDESQEPLLTRVYFHFDPRVCIQVDFIHFHCSSYNLCQTKIVQILYHFIPALIFRSNSLRRRKTSLVRILNAARQRTNSQIWSSGWKHFI